MRRTKKQMEKLRERIATAYKANPKISASRLASNLETSLLTVNKVIDQYRPCMAEFTIIRGNGNIIHKCPNCDNKWIPGTPIERNCKRIIHK